MSSGPRRAAAASPYSVVPRAGWRTIARVTTSRLGRYRFEPEAPGLYRVRAGVVAGPGVRMR